ncbi:transcription termination factor Rho [Corynebacterium poyangense]|uniref:transcription termination factor Rho n=1 Tax=Corynebacterium poyangense TaxID=2684405 RepID=UPI0037BFDE34
MTEMDTAANGGDMQNLASLRIPELRKLAAQKGIKGIYGLRKGELIAAIEGRLPNIDVPRANQARRLPPVEIQEEQTSTDNTDKDEEKAEGEDNSATQSRRHESRSAARRARRNRARQFQREQEDRGKDNPTPDEDVVAETKSDSQPERPQHSERSSDEEAADKSDSGAEDRDQNEEEDRGRRTRRTRRVRRTREYRDNREERDNRENREEREERSDRGNREDRSERNERNDNVQDVAGILDIVDNNVAFVRTTGYHAAPTDVYVNNQLIRRCGLRAGDAITGKVRMNRGGGYHGGKGGRNRNRYNNLIHVDTVNGMSVEEARQRPRFSKLTPLYPNQRLRLETDPKILTTRVIDLIMPIGKGQRALIVSPPKAGKTTILQNVANAIATNNPECYLMVVLVDERPEEVTDMERSVKGEVIASTFDRPPSEHTNVAELAIERAKRLVEQGQDVVVLLDSITRLGRAYNNSSPASGRILSGGVDSNALYPPKRFLGAARNIENGGSLTIIATAMVETGSAGDTVIFEEFKGTGNAELKLDRKISERRVFPAVDVNPSGTRKDELLLAPEEARVMHKLRRILSALDNQQAIDLLIKQLKKTRSNGEFLMQIAKSAPMAAAIEEEDYS